MTALYGHSTPDFESHFDSLYGYDHGISTGHLREDQLHRSRSSPSPFYSKSEMFPSNVPMAPNFSADALSDSEIAATSDWNNPFIFGDSTNNTDSTAPMANQNFDDFVPNWHPVNQYSTEDPHTMNIPTSQPQQANNYVFGFPQHQFPNPQLALSTNRARAPLSTPSNSDNVWNFQEDLSPGVKTDNSLSDQELFPASSFSTQASFQQSPWSPVGHSRVPSIGITQHGGMNFGSADALPISQDAYRTSYAGSIISMDSSPQARGIGTPNSERSPIFPAANLSSSPGSTSSQCYGHDHLHQTPRAMQYAFQQTQNLNVDMIGIGAQPQGTKHRRSQAPREPSHSPVSDYIMVESSDAVSTSFTSSMKVEPPTSAPRSPMTFVAEQFSPDSGKRPSTQGVIRKPREVKRPGGRSLGSHLPADKAARAKQLREEGSCWICCLQRDSCTPGHTCERCIKRNQRATMENGLGCDRTKLTDLKSFFLPDFLVRMGDKQVVSAFVEQHISRWRNTAVRIKLNMIWGIPPIDFELYEFEPKTNELLRQFQYSLDLQTGTRGWVKKNSPPLAMVSIENEDRDRYEQYLNRVVDKHLDKFVDRCFKYEKDEFQGRLLKLMQQLKPDNKEQTALIRDIFRLQVVTYIYARSATIPPRQVDQLYKLHHSQKNPNVTYGKATSPRMANRQLKVLYCSLFGQIMDSVLRRLQQVLRSSRGGAKWTSAFVALLGLAMCFEEVQRTAHANQDADALMGQMDEWDATQSAEAACRCIDEKFQFMANLFRWKYHRGFNPLRDYEDPKVRETLSESSLLFVRSVAALVQEKNDFLFEKQHVPILKANQDKYTSRLVARFLLAFWGPTPT